MGFSVAERFQKQPRHLLSARILPGVKQIASADV